MEKDELLTQLIKLIKENQELNGTTPPSVSKDTKPFDELVSFDSMTAIEVTVSLEHFIRKSTGINHEIDVSIFYTSDGKKALTKKGLTFESLTLDEIVDNLLNNIKKKG